MNKLTVIAMGLALISLSCVSKKKYNALQEKYETTDDKLSTTKTELAYCLKNRKSAKKEIEYLKNTNYKLLENVGNLSTLSKKGAANLEKSLERIREKDMRIQSLRDAVNKRDSITLALVTSLKGALGNLNDEDISINVEKGVVYVSISDRLLFQSGSYKVSEEAENVLGKVAKVLKDKPDIDFMVEGHTDTVPYQKGVLIDNWDLSVKRATSIVRILQDKFNVAPKRMTAAGRSYYEPIAGNDTEEGRARNRRTRIMVLPKIDRFYGLIEEGMEKAKAQSQKEEKQ